MNQSIMLKWTMKTGYIIISTLLLFTMLTIIPSFGLESDLNKSIFNNSIAKNMPLDIKIRMVDSCFNAREESGFSKEAKQFWSTLHINLLSITPEFQSLDGKRDTITEENISTATSCPPITTLNGTFTSVNGMMHKYYLTYNGANFEYKIDDIFPPQYQNVIDSPLKQFKAWNKLNIVQSKPDLLMDVVQCKDDLVLILKYTNNPACVKPETAQKLIERGWAKPV